MKKRLLLSVALGVWACISWAQDHPSPVYLGPDAPDWMFLLQEPEPNLYEIEAAYQNWYRNRPFEKNDYTQYYKKWMLWARPFVQNDGRIVTDNLYAEKSLEQKRAQVRASSQTETQLPWTYIGPVTTWDVDADPIVTWQTNIYSVQIAPSNSDILYAGGENGGAWKTTDKGLNWTSLTNDLSHGAFNSLAIHPTDPDIVYAGTRGILYKTSDGGATWTSVYTESNIRINEIAINPNTPDIVVAASDKGLLRTTDGGANWTKLFTNQVWTIKNKPGATDTIYIVRDDGGDGSDFMRSIDDGASWTTLSGGWWTPTGTEAVTGAILATCPADPEKLYVYLIGSGGELFGYIGVFVSDDAGANWTNTNPDNAIGNDPILYVEPEHTNIMTSNGTTGLQQGFYDMAIVVNPLNSDELIAGGTSWYKSTDGGETWDGIGGYQSGIPWSHPDIQWLTATGSDLWIASDGGLNYSTDFATTHEARMKGINGVNLWGFGSGWNEDILVGGRYHNGNMTWHESFPAGQYYRMGGGEAPTGYVSPGPERKVYHSDIGGKIVNPGFGNGVSNFSVGLWPNQSYAYYANSEMVWHPECWNRVYIGDDNILWKSEDGGTAYTELYTFPGTVDNKVYEIEIARSNPNVMYVSQWDGTDDAIWRSEDGGNTFVLCTALPLPNNNDRVKLAVSAENSDVLWVSVTYGSNGKKVYKSTDGGDTWTNLTTALLDNVRVTDIMAQYGTDGGVYLGTNAGVFYRNNTHSDWQAYSTGIPFSAETNRIRPFYRDGKIRNGTWGFGVWETPLFEASTVVPQAMADKLESECARDTFYFDDYSAVLHTDASWAWTFSGSPQSVIGANTRTPKVVFGSPGTSEAIMTLTTPLGTFKDTLHLTINNGCDLDSLPGKTLELDGSGDYVAITDHLNLNSNTVTISAWIKPNGTPNDWAAITFCRGGSTTVGLSLRNDFELRYHWDGGGWNWSSGLYVPDNEWSHVALVITPTSRTVYLNGVAAVHNTASNPEVFDATFMLGYDVNSTSRQFKGKIEEVAIYNESLTTEQIREIMHLTRTHTIPYNAELVAYYQFNETTGRVLDRVGVRHGSLVGDADRVTSTAPVGPGTSIRMDVTSGGVVDFTGTGLEMEFKAGGVVPDGELCVTRLNLNPDFLPTSDPVSPAYWVVRNYGTNQTFTELGYIQFHEIGSVPSGGDPADYLFFKRGSNADGDTWGTAQDEADELTFGGNGSAKFSNGNGITSFSQFIVSGPPGALPVVWEDFQAILTPQQTVELRWITSFEANTSHFELQRSADGFSFSSIGTVSAQGNSTQENRYQYTDTKPLSGRSYYRLLTHDFDGSTQISPMRTIDNRINTPRVVVSPNPVASGQAFQVTIDSDAQFDFYLFNSSGHRIFISSIQGTSQIPTEGWSPGIYAYRISNGKHLFFGKIVIE